MLGMLYGAAAADDAAPREVWWLHSARDREHHSFAALARTMVRALKRGHLCTIYSRPGPDDRLGDDYDREGHLSLPMLQEISVPRDAEFYLCGPARLLEDLQAGLKAWGVEASRIHVEIFGPAASLTPGVVGASDLAPHLPDGPQGSGPVVTFARSGLAVNWDPRFNSLLELAEACSVPVRWSCRSGVCHNCESGLIDGQLRYAPSPLDPPAEGNVLICCATPTSAIELDL